MGRNIEIDARRGGGAAHEILFGDVTIQATALHQDGTKTVFPDDTTIGISNGLAVLENVDVSPAGPDPAWAYKMTFRNHQTGRGWTEMVGVPAGSGPVKYPALTRFTTTLPPETTKAELQSWVATTEAAKNTAVQAAATATAPTDATMADKIGTKGSLTETALTAAYAGLPRPGQNALTGWFHVDGYGATGTGSTLDSAAFQNAINDASTVRGTVYVPPGTYLLDGIKQKHYVNVMAGASGLYRFGVNSNATGGVEFKHVAGSSTAMWEIAGGGASLSHIYMNGNGAPGTVLLNQHGFETRMDTVRVAYGTGVGIDFQGSCNTSYKDVFVDNCGSASLPGVRIRQLAPSLINTMDFTGFTVERCTGTQIEINTAINPGDAYPEFIRIAGLHVEAGPDTLDTATLVRIGNARSIHLVDPIIFGGPGPLISHEYTATTPGAGIMGGVTITGGTLLGRDAPTGRQPNYLVDLMSGQGFTISGTRVDNAAIAAVRIRSAYGTDAFIDSSVIGTSRVPRLVQDERSTPSTYPIHGDLEARGHISPSAPTVRPTAEGFSAAPAATLQDATDTSGLLFFGTGAAPGKAVAKLVFAKPFKKAPSVSIAAGDSATAAILAGGYYIGTETTNFIVYLVNTPPASQTGYRISYQVIGRA